MYEAFVATSRLVIATTMIDHTSPSQGILQLSEEYRSVLGADLFETLIASVWPLWDLTLGLVLFVDDEPKFISSCVMDVFRATNRNDVKRVPPLHTTDWYH